MIAGTLRTVPVVMLAGLLWLTLAGCQQSAVRPDSGDSMGQLGQLQRNSPADVYIQLGAEYMREGNLSEALKNAKKATIIDPHKSSGFNILALVYQRLGEKARAEEAFLKAIKLDHRDPYALNAYGSFLCADGRLAEADKMFQKAVANPLYESPWVALVNAGTCMRRAGNLAQAEAYLRRALQGNSRFPPGLLSMASVSLAQGNAMSARAYIQRFAEVADHTPESLWLGIRAENALGDRDQAASYALQLRSRYPDSEQVQFLREAKTP